MTTAEVSSRAAIPTKVDVVRFKRAPVVIRILSFAVAINELLECDHAPPHPSEEGSMLFAYPVVSAQLGRAAYVPDL